MKNRIKLRDMGWHVIQLWECQLKPKVREQNLEGLVYTLNKMMLLNYQVKLYDTAPETSKNLPVAAEETTDYSIKT